MKTTFIMLAISGMLIPRLASAELNYNEVNVGYSTTSYNNGDEDLTEWDAGVSKSISGNVYLGASLGFGKQLGFSAGIKKVSSVSAGAGYHFPLNDKSDVIVDGHIVLGSAKLAGNSTSADGHDFGAGIRTLIMHGLEGTLAVIHARTSNGTLSSNDTFLKVQFGFNFTPKFQLATGVDFKHDMTTYLGARFFY